MKRTREDFSVGILLDISFNHGCKSENVASASSSLMNEELVLQALRGCPNVVQSFGSDITTDSFGDSIYNVFLEFASGGSLFDFIKKIDSVDGNVPKVADFGLAKRHNVRDGSGVRGTQLFFSPEMVVFGIQEAPSDIWALGCIVLMMLTGKPPWACTSKSELVSRIATETPTIPHRISKAAQNFLSCCFVRHSAKRLTATELLSHFFLLESDECKEVFIQELAEVSNQKYLGVNPQSQHRPSALPSFIPVPSSSSKEEKDIPAAVERTCYKQIILWQSRVANLSSLLLFVPIETKQTFCLHL
ncbi:hypothetical protein SO802_021847 [Lithocarpus litseifolius]|uniref:Protein kinase domain-containing protein n=1 Tax=Lithocarpus litseifolius TaxID=425828 RepID=A0AAW2CG85_9ROSI